MKTYVIADTEDSAPGYSRLADLGYNPQLIFTSDIPIEENYRIDEDIMKKYVQAYLLPLDGCVRLSAASVLTGEEDTIICSHKAYPMLSHTDVVSLAEANPGKIIRLTAQNISMSQEDIVDMIDVEEWRKSDEVAEEEAFSCVPAYYIPKEFHEAIRKIIGEKKLTFHHALREIGTVFAPVMNVFLSVPAKQLPCRYVSYDPDFIRMAPIFV